MNELYSLLNRVKKSISEGDSKNIIVAIDDLCNQTRTSVILHLFKNDPQGVLKLFFMTPLPALASNTNAPKSTVQRFIDKWMSIYLSIAPYNAFFLCLEIISIDPANKTLFLKVAVDAFIYARIDPPEGFIDTVIQSSPTDLALISPRSADAFCSFLNERQIQNLFRSFEQKGDIEFFVQMTAVSPQKVLPALHTLRSMSFIARILNIIPKIVQFDILPLLARILELLLSTEIEKSYGATSVLAELNGLINWELSEEEKVAYLPIVPLIKENLDNNATKDPYRAVLMNAFGHCLRLKVAEVDDISGMLPINESDSYYFKVAKLNCTFALLNCLEIQGLCLQILDSVAETKERGLIVALLQQLPEYFDDLWRIDPDRAFLYINKAFNPLVLDKYRPMYMIKLLAHLTAEQLTDPRLSIDLPDVINKLYTVLGADSAPYFWNVFYKTGVSVPVTKLDWFGDRIDLSLLICQTGWSALVMEDIEQGLIVPNKLHLAIDYFARNAAASINYAFEYIMKMLDHLTAHIGFKVPSLPEPLFDELNEPIDVSELGKLLRSILNCMKEFALVEPCLFEGRKDVFDMCVFLYNIFPKEVFAVLVQIKSFDIPPAILNRSTSLQFSTSIVRLFVKADNKPPEFQRHLLAAVEIDRDICSSYIHLLQTKPKTLRTFLSLDENDTLFLSSKKELPFEEWIIRESDVPKLEGMGVRLTRTRVFELKEVFIEEPPVEDLFRHLWFGSAPLEKKDEIESYVLSSSNQRLMGAFFSFCTANSVDFNAEAFSEKLEVITEHGRAAVCLFLNPLEISLFDRPQWLEKLLLRILRYFGVSKISPQQIYMYYKRSVGVIKLLFKTIMALDPNFFGDIPLTIAEFSTDYESQLTRFYNSISKMSTIDLIAESFTIIADKFFNFAGNEQWLIPEISPLSRYIRRVSDLTSLPQRAKLRSTLLCSIIDSLDRIGFLPPQTLSLLSFVQLTPELAERAKKYFPILDIQTNFAPSFTRRFIRLICSPLSPMISKEEVLEILSKSIPVHPGLVYDGFNQPTWEFITDVSRVKIGISPLNEAMFSYPGRECLQLFDFYLSTIRDFGSEETKFKLLDMTKALFETATSAESPLCFAIDCAKSVFKVVDFDFLSSYLMSPLFFKRPSFVNVLLIWTMFRMHQNRSDLDEVILQIRENPIFYEDEKLRDIFRTFGSSESLKVLLALGL